MHPVAPNCIAVDLGAESCRVSLLHWENGAPAIQVVHRCSNGPVSQRGSLFWDLDRILDEVQQGIRRCAAVADAPIASIGVDGWAVDYVRLDDRGRHRAAPFCYRDVRTERTFNAAIARCKRAALYRMGGAQPARINTMFQLMADGENTAPRWVNLPEYLLARLSGRVVAEYTNATHTGLADAHKPAWNRDAFACCGLSLQTAPELVPTGTDLASLRGPLALLPEFRRTRVIAPACHDTASAIAGIAAEGDDWAYISSGTWSLVGTMLREPILSDEALHLGFTNLGAAGGRKLFHQSVSGMWLLRQTLEQLFGESAVDLDSLIAQTREETAPTVLLDVDDPRLIAPGQMATRINAQLRERGAKPIPEEQQSAPAFACLIFHSLAARYAQSLADLRRLTGKNLRRVVIVGGGSRNDYLNALVAQATGLEIVCGKQESATIGNLAVQLASLEGKSEDAAAIRGYAALLTPAQTSGFP